MLPSWILVASLLLVGRCLGETQSSWENQSLAVGGLVWPRCSLTEPLSSVDPLQSFEEWKSKQQRHEEKLETAEEQQPSAALTSETVVHDVLKNPKQRFNYASFDCGAVVLAANSGAKSTTAILSENKDQYLLNVCDTKEKFVVIELCDEIWVDTLVLANYEFFSSMFREFRVSVSDRYPPAKGQWQSVGVFTARNERKPQASGF